MKNVIDVMDVMDVIAKVFIVMSASWQSPYHSNTVSPLRIATQQLWEGILRSRR